MKESEKTKLETFCHRYRISKQECQRFLANVDSVTFQRNSK